MTTPRDHLPTRLRLSRDTLALIDETVAKAREEFADPEIDRQHVLELLLVNPLRQRGVSLESTMILSGLPKRGNTARSCEEESKLSAGCL